MPDMTPQTGTNARFQPGHNPVDDVNTRVILSFTIGLFLFVLAVCLVLARLMNNVQSAERNMARTPSALLSINKGQYPGPGLQANPARDLPNLASAAEAKLNSYGWEEPE